MFGRKKEARVEIQANLVWEVARDPQSGRWLGVCRALNLNASGASFQEFHETANEVMHFLFVDLFEDSELEAFLRRNNWRMLGEIHPGETPVLDVPFEIQRRAEVGELVSA